MEFWASKQLYNRIATVAMLTGIAVSIGDRLVFG
jgi:hypothetical protein